MSAIFSDDSDLILTRGKHIAHEVSHEYVGTEHIFAAMSEIGVPVLAEFLEARGITVASIVEKIREMGRGRSFPASSLPFSPGAKNALCRAIQLTMTPPVTSQRLLYSVLELACDGDGTSFLLARLDISIEDMRTVLLTLEPPECWPADSPTPLNLRKKK